jgi:hypothetical protein
MASDDEITIEDEPAEKSARAAEPISILPFVITLVALLLYFGFQSLHLTFERGNLAQVKSSQEGAMQEAQKIHAQFKSLVSKTSDLANKGHAGAKMVMEGLQARGFALAPESASPRAAESKAGK